jgi:hypothetical protein
MMNWTGRVMAQLSYYPSVCLEGPWKTMKNVRIAGVLARIASRHLLNKYLEHYRCTNQVSSIQNTEAQRTHVETGLQYGL